MEIKKLETTDFDSHKKKMENDMEKIRYDLENYGDHFAMVENFVEKYIPIRI